MTRIFPGFPPLLSPMSRALLAAGWLTLGALPAATVAAASPAPAQASVQRYDIPPGALGPALSVFGGAAGVTVSIDPALVDGVRTGGLRGDFTAADALARLLAGTGLHAMEQAQGTYVLRRLPAAEGATLLAPVQVRSDVASATTEGSGSYAAASQSAAAKLPLSLRETPQSVTVITRQRLDDTAVTSLHDAMQQVPGIFVSEADSERISYQSRGYAITNFQIDGVPTTYGGSVRTDQDMAIFDRVEVVRGATGLVSGAGDPSGTINPAAPARHRRRARGSASATAAPAGSPDALPAPRGTGWTA